MAKEFAQRFYNSQEWKRCRDGYISSVNGMCERCLAKGYYNPGYIVHHIVHLTPSNITNPDISLNWDNLEYVCMDCHNEIHTKANPLTDGLYFTGDGQIAPIKKSK